MTRFAHIDYPTEHLGVARAEAAFATASRLGQGFNGTRGITALLLAAVVSALLVLADRLVDTGSGLLATWMVTWVVAFAALALFATPVRHLAGAMMKRWDNWSASLVEARSDQRLWAAARADARVMTDLQAAMARNAVDTPHTTAALHAGHGAAVQRISLRQLMAGWHDEADRSGGHGALAGS